MLDKYLFQGYSGGARVEIVNGFSLYTELGRSDRTGDSSRALNQMYGVTLGRAPVLGVRIDAHYSRFSSPFGIGNYQALSVSRSFGQAWRLDVLAGNQTFVSHSTTSQGSRFLTTTIDASLGGVALRQRRRHRLSRGAAELRPVAAHVRVPVRHEKEAAVSRLRLGDVCVLFMASIAVVGAAPQAGADASLQALLDRAERQASAFVDLISKMNCVERVTQLKLDDSGRTTERRESTFDYLVLLHYAGSELSLAESRLPVSSDRTRKKEPPPLLLSNGFSLLFLVFHPYYAPGFDFTLGAEQNVAGRRFITINFRHIRGTRSPAALAVRGREYEMDLEGTAAIDSASGAIVRITAGLAAGMDDVGLRNLGRRSTTPRCRFRRRPYWLPARVTVDVASRHQHWRNIHEFSKYKRFGVAHSRNGSRFHDRRFQPHLRTRVPPRLPPPRIRRAANDGTASASERGTQLPPFPRSACSHTATTTISRRRSRARCHPNTRTSSRAARLACDLGVLGFVLCLLVALYPLRKRWAWLGRQGVARHWLDYHGLLGILAPLVITFHASFKAGGFAGIAYWMMILVALSGLAGRYLYAQIPSTLNAAELSLKAREEESARLHEQLSRLAGVSVAEVDSVLRAPDVHRTERMALAAALAQMILFDLLFPFRVWRFRRKLIRRPARSAGRGPIDDRDLKRAISLARREAQLKKKVAFLSKSKRLLHLWHVVHRPFSASFAVFASIHIVLMLMMGFY